MGNQDIEEKRATAEAALREADAAWGDSYGRHALPKAAQLRLRIVRGESVVRAHPRNMRYRRELGKLYDQYNDMGRDEDDQARCARWEEAYARFQAALREYNEAAKEEVKT